MTTTMPDPDRVPLRTPTPGRTDAHFSPGYGGEIPDHLGVFETCPMPSCVASRRQHEAAAIFDGETVDRAADRRTSAQSNDAH